MKFETPLAIVPSALEDALRQQPGYIDRLERVAANLDALSDSPTWHARTTDSMRSALKPAQ